MVMEGGSLSVCVMGTLDPGDSVEVGLSVTPAGKQLCMGHSIYGINVVGLDVPMNTLYISN